MIAAGLVLFSPYAIAVSFPLNRPESAFALQSPVPFRWVPSKIATVDQWCHKIGCLWSARNHRSLRRVW